MYRIITQPFGRCRKNAIFAPQKNDPRYEKEDTFRLHGQHLPLPAAEGILRSKAEKAGLAEHYAIDSAGTYSGHSGDLPDPRMREAAQRRGYRLTHRARPVLDEDFSRFDMLIAMDERNYDALDRLAFTLEDKAKIYRMTDFSSRHDYDHVPDPYYEGREGFELVLDLLEDACTGLLEYTAKETES